MTWKEDHEWWAGKNFEGGNCDLFQCIIPEFALWKTMKAVTAVNIPAKIPTSYTYICHLLKWLPSNLSYILFKLENETLVHLPDHANTLVAKPKDWTATIPKPVTGHDPEPVPSTSNPQPPCNIVTNKQHCSNRTWNFDIILIKVCRWTQS